MLAIETHYPGGKRRIEPEAALTIIAAYSHTISIATLLVTAEALKISSLKTLGDAYMTSRRPIRNPSPESLTPLAHYIPGPNAPTDKPIYETTLVTKPSRTRASKALAATA